MTPESGMTPEHPREDVGAWLLGALPDDEAREFAAFLASGNDEAVACRREIAELQPAVDVLPMASPQVDPPAALRDRIMNIVESEAQLLRAAGPEADRVRSAQDHPRRRRWLIGARPALVAAAACVLIIAGVLAGTLISDNGPDTRVLRASAPEGATVALHMRGDKGELEMTGMPPAPAGRVYQVWLVKGSGAPQPTHTLFSVPRDGRARVAIGESLRSADQVLVSAEPPGGSSAPTSSPVIGAKLT
jgi:anti-sigma-K factor RskA